MGGARGPIPMESIDDPPVEQQGALGLSIWPKGFKGRFGFGASAQFGSGVHIRNFDGQLITWTFGATARVRTTFGPFGFELGAGPGVRLAQLDGTATLSNAVPPMTVAVHHGPSVLPALDVVGVVDVSLGQHITVGVVVDGSVHSFQDYTLNRALPLLETPLVDCLVGLRLSVGID